MLPMACTAAEDKVQGRSRVPSGAHMQHTLSQRHASPRPSAAFEPSTGATAGATSELQA